MENLNQLSLKKKIIYCLIPLVVFLVVGEVGSRCLYFQLESDNPLALITAYEFARKKVQEYKISKAIEDYQLSRPPLPEKHYADFYNSPEMKEIREEYGQKYEMAFKELVRLSDEADVVLMVLYLPSREESRETSRTYFQQLVKKYDVRYLDVTQVFGQYSSEVIYLFPENGHLSRFGNQILVGELISFLEPYLNHHSQIVYPSRPNLLGDLGPNDNSIWTIVPERPYRVITNSQGLRRKTDVTFPKSDEKTRILFLGDSFTFGPYLDNHDCYPQLLEEKKEKIEAINAGKAGYTICDEVSYFGQRGKYLEPDIVVLQVLDNDLYGFFPHKRDQFCRDCHSECW